MSKIGKGWDSVQSEQDWVSKQIGTTSLDNCSILKSQPKAGYSVKAKVGAAIRKGGVVSYLCWGFCVFKAKILKNFFIFAEILVAFEGKI